MAPIENKAENSSIEDQDPVHWLLHGLVLFFVLLGVFIVILVEVRPTPPALKESGLVMAGFLMGFASVSFEEHFRARPERRRAKIQRAKDLARADQQREEARHQHEKEHAEDRHRINELRDENQNLLARVSAVHGTIEESKRRKVLLSQTETNNAYYLGYIATTLSLNADSIPDNIKLIRQFCYDLGLQFSEEEEQMLKSTPMDQINAEKVSEMVLLKAQHLRPPLWCFFSFGNKDAWLCEQVKSAHSTQAVLKELEILHANPFLEMDPRYTQVVDALLKVLRPYRGQIPSEAREILHQKVLKALDGIPPIYLQGRNTRTPVQSTEWLWVEDDWNQDGNAEIVAMRIIGKHVILA